MPGQNPGERRASAAGAQPSQTTGRGEERGAGTGRARGPEGHERSRSETKAIWRVSCSLAQPSDYVQNGDIHLVAHDHLLGRLVLPAVTEPSPSIRQLPDG